MFPPPLPNETSADAQLPPPAPLVPRTLAFLADSVLVLLASALALKFLLPVFCPNGLSVFLDYARKISATYQDALDAAARGNAVSADAMNALAEQAAQNADLMIAFSETISTVSFVVGALYFILTEHFMRGRTLGKKIFSLRTVVAGTTHPPLFLQTLSRAFWKTISIVPAGMILTLLAVVNAHVVVFAGRHRGWHDRLARTEVVDERGLQDSSSKK